MKFSIIFAVFTIDTLCVADGKHVLPWMSDIILNHFKLIILASSFCYS